MSSKGYANTQLDAIAQDDDFTRRVVNTAMVVGTTGKPETLSELQERIRRYFERCGDEGLRPGVESMSASLGISRQTFWRWCRGELGVTKEWQDTCEQARSVVFSFLEQALMSGKISPPSGIFLLKNWCGYTDTVSIDKATETEIDRKTTPEEIALRHHLDVSETAPAAVLPKATFINGGDE